MGFFSNLISGARKGFRRIGEGLSGASRKVGSVLGHARRIGESVRNIPIVGAMASPFLDPAMKVLEKAEQGTKLVARGGELASRASQIHNLQDAKNVYGSGMTLGRDVYGYGKGLPGTFN
jgi:predicted trehalose synthase